MDGPVSRNGKKIIIGALISVLTVVNYGVHLSSGFHWFGQFDLLFQILYFFPVMLASLWFALEGGLWVWAITSVTLIPHQIIHWEGSPIADLNRLLLIVAYLVMAFVLGNAVLTQRREHELAKKSETLAEIGKSISSIAHEMKTPLIAICGFTRMVRKNIPEGSPEAEKLDIVMTEALRMESLLKGVLDFARPLEVKREWSRIEQIIKECLAVTGYIAEQHGIVLETRIEPDLPPVLLDGMRIKEILINLITNAIQASPAGRNVTIGCLRELEQITLEIADSGCGIPHERRKEIFSPFFSTKKEGVGLGLPIVKKIVDAHEGSLTILDNPGGGIIFRVQIPCCADQHEVYKNQEGKAWRRIAR